MAVNLAKEGYPLAVWNRTRSKAEEFAILARDFTTNFSLKLMHKDLTLIMSAAYGLNIPLPVTASVRELFGTAKSCCDPEENFSSVIRALEAATHFEVKKA